MATHPKRRPLPTARLLAAVTTAAATLLVASPTPGQTPAQLAAYEACIEGMVSGRPAAEAIRTCQKPAEEGLTGAQFALGELFLRDGPTKNTAAAYRWYRLAAEQGNPAAQFAIAVMVGNGIGTEADRDRALAYLGRSYCAGYPLALSTVAEQEIDPKPWACEDHQPAPIDGVWSGELEWVQASSPAGKWKTDSLAFRVAISGDSVTVEAFQDGAWAEVKAGKFHLDRLKGNAVVYSLDEGWDFDGNWVEGWTINLATLDADTMAVTWTRSVHNLQVPAGLDSHTFTAVAAGRFTREPSPADGAIAGGAH